jgi:putative spermidine/putrescine transport system substrate-binding protein
MLLTRRIVLAGSAGLLATPALHAARAADGKVVMASWGGGTAAMWHDAFGTPFTKATGIPFTLAEVPDPAAAVAAAQGRPQHNVIIAASYQAANLALHGLVEELTEADIPNIKAVPEQYWIRNADGKLLGMPVYFIYYGIAYNTSLAKASDFTSWKALEDPKWKGQISITRPLFLAPYDLTLYSKIMGGNESNIQPGIPMLTAVAKNATAVYSSMASLQQQLAQGEVTAAPYYSGQVQLLRHGGEKDIDIALPKEGGLVLSYILSVPTGAQDRAAAIRFLNGAIAPEKQIAAARNGYLPLATNVTLPDDVNKDLGMTMDEVRQRNWSPNWYTIAGDLENRIHLVEKIVDQTG